MAGVPSRGETVSTSLYDGRIGGHRVSGPHSEALSEHLGRPVQLVALDPSEVGADDFPVTLMSTASVAALGEALDDGVPDPRRLLHDDHRRGAAACEE